MTPFRLNMLVYHRARLVLRPIRQRAGARAGRGMERRPDVSAPAEGSRGSQGGESGDGSPDRADGPVAGNPGRTKRRRTMLEDLCRRYLTSSERRNPGAAPLDGRAVERRMERGQGKIQRDRRRADRALQHVDPPHRLEPRLREIGEGMRRRRRSGRTQATLRPRRLLAGLWTHQPSEAFPLSPGRRGALPWRGVPARCDAHGGSGGGCQLPEKSGPEVSLRPRTSHSKTFPLTPDIGESGGACQPLSSSLSLISRTKSKS